MKPGTFTKGDPRINRKGRPKSFDALRELAKQIAQEKVEGKDGSVMSRIELILRRWSLSDNPQLAGRFIEIAYGKVPDEIINDGKVTITIVRDETPPAEPSQEAGGLRDQSG